MRDLVSGCISTLSERFNSERFAALSANVTWGSNSAPYFFWEVLCPLVSTRLIQSIAAVSSDCKHRLMVGNLVVCNTDEMGNCEGLWSREDEDNMVKASVAVKCNDGNFYHVLKLDE